MTGVGSFIADAGKSVSGFDVAGAVSVAGNVSGNGIATGGVAAGGDGNVLPGA